MATPRSVYRRNRAADRGESRVRLRSIVCAALLIVVLSVLV
jgi:hypothetical protein